MDLISAIHPGGCEHHTHPARILKVRAPRRGVPGQDIRPLTVRAQDPEVLAAMRDEVVSFVSEYLPGVDPADFWAACAREIFRWPERGFRYGEMRLR